MSTRARVIIKDIRTGEKNYLYRGSDGYIEGLGADLVDECDKYASAPDVDSFSMKLMKGKACLEGDVFGEDACLDWVYEIEFGSETIGIYAYHVDWSGDNKRPVRDRLGTKVEVRSYVADYRDRETRRIAKERALRKKLGPCPVCGGSVDIDLYGDGSIHLRCFNFRCPKRVGIETTSENEAIRLWKLLKNMG